MNLLNKKKIRQLTYTGFILIFSSLISVPSGFAQQKNSEQSDSSWYHQTNRRYASGSARNQVMVNLQLDRAISQNNVSEALLKEFEKLKYETIPQFGSPASSIYIYVYETQDDPRVQWLGLLTWDNRKIETPRPDPDSIEPTISLNSDRINIIEKRTGTKFGLSEETRVAVFVSRALILIKQQNYADSTRPVTNDSTALAKHKIQMVKILDQLERSLASQNNVSKKDIIEIYHEGLEKGWPLPPHVDRSMLKQFDK